MIHTTYFVIRRLKALAQTAASLQRSSTETNAEARENEEMAAYHCMSLLDRNGKKDCQNDRAMPPAGYDANAAQPATSWLGIPQNAGFDMDQEIDKKKKSRLRMVGKMKMKSIEIIVNMVYKSCKMS